MSHTEPLIEARGLVKRFGGTQALNGVDLSIRSGEVHALVGENGAGKSTLGRCLAGVLIPDEGELLVDAAPVQYRAPRDALNDGITIVEQELALVPAMSVADNVLLGHRKGAAGGLRRRRALSAEVQGLNDRFALGLEVSRTVESLTVADQQKVEILRALSRQARIIVMDEPTARLARDEADNLLRVIRMLAEQGTAIVFISHILDDVLSIAERVTVMRNGEVVKSGEAAAETPASLVEAMLGRAASLEFPEKRPVGVDVAPILSVRNLSDGRRVHDVSFEVRPGEILGLGGLVGCGRSEVARLVFGAERPARGAIEIDGAVTGIGSVRHAVGHGLAYLPENRKDLGLLLDLSSQENATLAHLDQVTRWGFISPRRERREATAILERLSVSPADPALRVKALSGGNQQKVLFSKWLWQAPRLLIADEPTRGVDVGAKFAIYELLVELAAEGMAILLISSEMEELIGLSHRVVVMARGRGVAELDGEQVHEERILHAAFASRAEPAREASA